MDLRLTHRADHPMTKIDLNSPNMQVTTSLPM
jgi:hypothetical protein